VQGGLDETAGIHPVAQLADDYKFRILEFAPFSFDDAQKVAFSKNGISTGWAIKNHDPTLDDYSVIKKWLAIEDPVKRMDVKKAMLQNPTIQRHLVLLEKLTKRSFMDAENIAREQNINPDWIISLKHLLEPLDVMSKVSFSQAEALATQRQINTDWAIVCHDAAIDNQFLAKQWETIDGASSQKFSMFEVMIRNPTIDFSVLSATRQREFDIAIAKGRMDIIKFLVDKRKAVPNSLTLRKSLVMSSAITHGSPDFTVELMRYFRSFGFYDRGRKTSFFI
jgi:hypothetical protein